jgi:hypothetical protein
LFYDQLAPLKDLFLKKTQFDYADLLPCLEVIPSLPYLRLKMLRGPDVGLTRHFAASLDPLSNSNRLLLPNLKYSGALRVVLLSTCWPLDGIYPMIAELFRVLVSKLKLVKVLSTLPYHVTADVQEELRILLEEGMLVRVVSLVRPLEYGHSGGCLIKRKDVCIYGGVFWCFDSL